MSLPVKLCVKQDEYVRQLIGKFKFIIVKGDDEINNFANSIFT